MITIICAQCGKECQRQPSTAIGQEHRFCSSKCMGKWYSVHMRGDASPTWNGGEVTFTCDQCGRELERWPSEVKGRKHSFCSVRCRRIWNTTHKQSKVTFTCDQCGKESQREPSEVKDQKHSFCSCKCQGKWQTAHTRGSDSPGWKGGKATFICNWCGKEFQRQPSALKGRKYGFCSKGCQSKWQSETRNGENCPAWKGGKPKQKRSTREYRNWRIAVFQRDAFTCQLCKECGGKIEAHHIASWVAYPVYRFDVDNGMTLCANCHRWLRTKNGVGARQALESMFLTGKNKENTVEQLQLALADKCTTMLEVAVG